MLDSVAHLNHILLLDWYVVKCGSKKGRRKDLGLKEIGLHAQILLTIIGSPTSGGGGALCLFKKKEDFHIDIDEDILEENDYIFELC